MSLFTWGAHADRGLIKSDVVDIHETVHFVCSQNEILCASAGKATVAFLRGDGRLSIFRTQEEDGNTKAGKLKNLSDIKEPIDFVCCGETTAVAILRGGKALMLDRFNKQRPLEILRDKHIAQIVCGNEHYLALTSDGQLFTWGQDSNGQLGQLSLSPQPLQSLAGIPLSQVSAGGEHSFALSVSGAVFGWGKNNAGQLGLGDNIDRPEPVEITTLSLKRTVQISCGEEHTVFLTKDGIVFTCGSGHYGQLGHNSLRDELRPRLVAELWGSKVSQVACGRHHTLVLVGESNAILAFGRGEQGQLGNGQKTNCSVPLYVHFPQDHTETFRKITAGGHLSFAFCQTQSDPDGPHLKESKGLLVLDYHTVQRWVSESGSRAWNKINKKMLRMFGSASCINGSFIDTSSDKHYLTSTGNSGLDLLLARLVFEEMTKKPTVLTEVESVVQLHLLPSLIPNPAGVEGLRVYLILPELLRVLLKQDRGTDLTISLAEAILRLQPDSLRVLQSFWSTLPGSYLRTLVKVLRKVAVKALDGIKDVENASKHGQSFQLTVKVLQKVYEAIRKAKRRIPDQCFQIKEVNSVFNELNDRLIELNQPHNFLNPLWQAQQISVQNMMALYGKNIVHLKSSPCIFNIEAKQIVLNLHLQRRRANETTCFLLKLRRTALLEDTITALLNATTHDLRKFLGVQYMENSMQHKISDVDKRDFFLNVFRELYNSKMFVYNDTETLVWFPSEPRVEVEKYFCFGILCGLALYNNSVVRLPFPSALFKKLLNIQPTLEDLSELSSVTKRSLQQVLDYDNVESMDLFFSINWYQKEVELDPNEAGKPVTDSNKKEFVQAYVDYALNKSVEKVFEEFKRGFFKVCAQDVVEMFHPEELRGMMVGREEYDWDVLKKNASYEFGFYETHPTIALFWEVFKELSEDDKKAFLLFLTGFDRVPILGMQKIKMRVQGLPNSTPDHLPEALTCHAILMLHPYQSKEVLRTRLCEALHHKRGFWED